MALPNPIRPAWFSLARLATFLFALGALFSILLALYRALHAWYVGILSTLRPRRCHAVVFGLGRIGMQIVRDLRANDREDELGVGPRRRVIVVEPEEDHPNADTVRRLGAIVLFGDAREPATRRRARLHSAREAFVACGDDALDVDLALDLRRVVGLGREHEHHETRVPDPLHDAPLPRSSRLHIAGRDPAPDPSLLQGVAHKGRMQQSAP